MTAGELLLVVAGVLCSIGFAALVVVLMRVLDALRDVRTELDDLRSQTTPLILDLQDSTDEARAAVVEARTDLERFDQVLGSAEAISGAVGATVARASFSSPMIKAAGFARGTSRTIARLRGVPTTGELGAAKISAIEAAPSTTTPRRRRRRA